MALHVIFIDDQAEQLSDVTSNFTSVQIPSNAFIMRIADSEKSYSNSTLTKLFEIDNTFYSKVLEYTTKGDYPYIDINVSDFGGFTAIFNQLSAQFIGSSHFLDIYDFSDYGGSSSGGDIDFSTIVTALNSIASALSALTNLNNLSNLADLANIITAINNKDNQNNIVDILSKIFIYKTSSTSGQFSSISGQNISTGIGSDSTSLSAIINRFRNVFCTNANNAVANASNANKFLFYLLTLSSASNNGEVSTMLNNSNLKAISDKLDNIEIKLEQNLPFTTIVNNDYIDNCVSASVAYNKKIENIPFN